MIINKRRAFSLMEVLVATLIFSFVALSMMSVYYAANRNVLQNFRADKLKADVGISMRAIANVLSQATRIEKPTEGSSGSDLLVMTNVESGATFPCCPLVPSSYGAPKPKWYRFCVSSDNKLWFYSGNVNNCQGCPNLSNYVIPRYANFLCGIKRDNRMLLANYISTDIPPFSRVRQPTKLTTTVGLLSRKENASHTRLIDIRNTVNVYLNTKWNINSAVNPLQSPVDYTLEGIFSVIQPRG